MTKKSIILGIESSCDETAAAIIQDNEGIPKILSNIVSSQIDRHREFGGVVPELAARAHIDNIEFNDSILIYNIVGQLVYSDNSNGNQKTIDLTELDSGIYLLKISNNNSSYTYRIIKK